METIQKEQLAAGIKPVYSLVGDPALPDLHAIYMQCEDPTEYDFAMEAWGSWEHHEHMIASCKWFMDYLTKWRSELQVQMKSQAIKALMKVATTDGNRGITAAKYISDFGWEKKAGRPTKAQTEKNKKEKAAVAEETAADAKRLGLRAVK